MDSISYSGKVPSLPLPLLFGILSLWRSGRPPLPGLSKVFEDLALATPLGLPGQPTTMGMVSALMVLALLTFISLPGELLLS